MLNQVYIPKSSKGVWNLSYLQRTTKLILGKVTPIIFSNVLLRHHEFFSENFPGSFNRIQTEWTPYSSEPRRANAFAFLALCECIIRKLALGVPIFFIANEIQRITGIIETRKTYKQQNLFQSISTSEFRNASKRIKVLAGFGWASDIDASLNI
jgi:hypothetical protein